MALSEDSAELAHAEGLDAARLRQLVELLPVGLWLADAQGNIVLGNEAGRRIWQGARYVGMDGYSQYKGWWPDGRPVAAEEWALTRAISRGETCLGDEIEIECFDGTRKVIRNSAAPLRDESGRLLGALAVNEDITDLKRHTAEREKVSRLYASLNAINELVSRATSAAELLQGACAIAASTGDFQFALVRMLREGSTLADIAAYAGERRPAHLDVALELAVSTRGGDSLVAVACRTGRPVLATGDDFEARRALSRLVRENGARSGAAFPLYRAGACIGALLIMSRDPRAFDGEIVKLLERMAQSVSHGLEVLEAGEALRRFRLALDQSEELIGLVDRESMRYIDVNEAMCVQLGYSRDELLRMRPDEILAFSREELERTYDWLIANPGRSARVRGQYYCKDGSTLQYEATRQAVRSGARWVIVSIGRDIRERLEAEEKIARSERELRALVHNAPDVIARWSPELRCLFVNNAVERATGLPASAFIGLRIGEMSTEPQFQEVITTTCAEVFARGEERSAQFSHSSPRGRVHYDMRFVPEPGGDGRVASVLTVARDVTDRVRADAALRKSEDEFRALAENAPDGIMRFDERLRCVFVNPAVLKTSGEPARAFLGCTAREFAVPEALRRLLGDAVQRAFLSGETQTFDYQFAGPRGERHYQGRIAPERGPDGRPVSVLGISRDITDRKRAERAMAESEARLRSIVEASAEPLLLVGPDGVTLFANPAAAALFGRTVGELEGAPLGLPLAAGRPADVHIVLPGGGVRPAEMQAASTELDGREVLVVSLHDLSERKRFEEHIQHLATHDRLTGLPNRALLGDRIEQAITHARRSATALALLFVDLDHFKLVNDSFGHAAGDALLVQIGERLRATVREGDTVARLGGDEFVILLTDLSQPRDSAVVAQKIADALEKPVCVEGSELHVAASIGIALYPDDGEGLEGLLQCADAAMYRAKDSGRNGFQYYSSEMGEQARQRVETEAGLRAAIERDELRLHYQPQVDLASGRIAAVEALMRWEHPKRGMVSPAAFIPVAEESGLIVAMGQWALIQACRDAAGWTASGLAPVHVSVNLSARQFWRGSVTEAVRIALAESGLPAAQLEVEITESVLARDLRQVMLALEQLRRMGVGVAIDDFGTGYSSLAYLRSLPIQKLKIDKSFIQGIPADREATALVGEIVRLAHVLSLEVVAEGVETADQALFLRECGCEAMQGFLFSRPLPAGECAALLRSGRRFVADAPPPERPVLG